MTPAPPLPVEHALRDVRRRFRVPAVLEVSAARLAAEPASVLAQAMENARLALSLGQAPSTALSRYFVDALAEMIHDAMRVEGGDPVFQAMVLRHRQAVVREYASLSAHADQDRRAVYAAVNTIAHPAKQQREPPGPRRDALISLHALATAASWPALQDTALQFLNAPEIANEAGARRALEFLAQSREVQQLCRLAVLASDSFVLQYQSLWNRKVPDAGSAQAVAEGVASQKRGAAVEALAVHALQEWADQLNKEEPGLAAGMKPGPAGQGPAPYRVVSSMRVPASIPASHDRAKTEWDAVLLRRQEAGGDAAVWGVCMLVEAKASVEAATTDLPPLLRGLRLLSHADPDGVYAFVTQQGEVLLSGASLHALTDDRADLARTVLYCCDAVEKTPRLLSAASKMQLMSAQPSLEFADAIAEGKQPDPNRLETLWHELLASSRWKPVLNQYATLVQVRDLMVHPDDLISAVYGQESVRSGST